MKLLKVLVDEKPVKVELGYTVMQTCAPVSYTHLDVYKRQALAIGSTSPAPTSATAAAVDPGPGSGTTSAPDQHEMHLCHCAHAHGGTLTTQHVLPGRLDALATAVSGKSDRLPSSVVGEPEGRPPRVQSA